MQNILRFIFSKSFVKNAVLASIVLLAILVAAFFSLGWYTDHGKSTAVPDLSNMTLDEAIEVIEEANLRFELEDSTYNETLAPGVVLAQNPRPTFKDPKTGEEKSRQVKRNRKIYLQVNKKVPPLVEMPDFEKKISARIALKLLESMGLKVKVKEERSRAYPTLVLRQEYKGKSIVPGTKLYKGETVTIVVGVSNENQNSTSKPMKVPEIEGKTYSEAQTILRDAALKMGAITSGCGSCQNRQDTLNATIISQTPAGGGTAKKYSKVSIRLAD